MTVENSTIEHESSVNTSSLVETKTDFRYTIGNYADTWNSESEYDPETGWRLTEGEMSGAGNLTTTVVASRSRDWFSYTMYPGEYYDGYDVTDKRELRDSSVAVRKEDFVLKQDVYEGDWRTTERTIAVTDIVDTDYYQIWDWQGGEIGKIYFYGDGGSGKGHYESKTVTNMNGDVTSDWNVTYNSSGASWDSRYNQLPAGGYRGFESAIQREQRNCLEAESRYSYQEITVKHE